MVVTFIIENVGASTALDLVVAASSSSSLGRGTDDSAFDVVSVQVVASSQQVAGVQQLATAMAADLFEVTATQLPAGATLTVSATVLPPTTACTVPPASAEEMARPAVPPSRAEPQILTTEVPLKTTATASSMM